MRRSDLRIISRKAIRIASAAHGEWSASLAAWFKITKNADWQNPADVRQTFNSADFVGPFVVFDIANNRCRLIASINYKWKMVYIRHILSHAEYDREDWQL